MSREKSTAIQRISSELAREIEYEKERAKKFGINYSNSEASKELVKYIKIGRSNASSSKESPYYRLL